MIRNRSYHQALCSLEERRTSCPLVDHPNG